MQEVSPHNEAQKVVAARTWPLIANDWRSLLTELWARASARRFLICLLLVDSVLLFSRLENTAFWIDEAMNALLAENILSFGYPITWDGAYLVEPYFNVEVNDQLVRVSHTWLQYYEVAASFLLFGKSAFAARLPSVICGLLCLVVVYFLALRMSRSERLAAIASLLLAFNTAFLLYSRLARYFSLSFLFSALVLLCYLRWRDDPGRRNLLFFTVCTILLFYSHFIIWPFIVVTIVTYHLVFERRNISRLNNREFLFSIGLSLLMTVPWILYSNPLHHSIADWSGSTYSQRLLIFFWKVDTWVFPFVTLSALALALSAGARRGWLSARQLTPLRREYLLLLWLPLYLVVIAAAPHPMMSSQYTSPLLPFAVIGGAFLILRIHACSRWFAAVTLALLLSTNLFQVLPFMIVEKLPVPTAITAKFIVNPRAQFNAGTPLAHYLTEQLAVRSPLFEYGYFVTHSYNHRLKAIIAYLKEQGSPSQTVLAPWHDADAVRFYTGMNVVYHFKPSFTIEQVKRLVYRNGVTPDWIIPNAYYEPDQPFFKYRIDDYDRILISTPKDYIYENEPNLDFFMWRDNRNAAQGVYVLKRKEQAHYVDESMRPKL